MIDGSGDDNNTYAAWSDRSSFADVSPRNVARRILVESLRAVLCGWPIDPFRNTEYVSIRLVSVRDWMKVRLWIMAEVQASRPGSSSFSCAEELPASQESFLSSVL